MNKIIIAKNLKKICKAQGFTQQATGELLGVTFQQIQKYMSGKNRITADRLFTLAKGLNVPIQDFFKGCK